MSESKKIILKKNNLDINKMSKIDFIVMSVDELKNLVPNFKGSRRGRPSKQDYIDEIMVRRANNRHVRDTMNETKDEVFKQEEKGGEPVVIQPEQEEGKRRYRIADFNQTKQEAYRVGSEQDFKNYIAGLKQRNEYPSQRGRISEEIYRKYIAYCIIYKIIC